MGTLALQTGGQCNNPSAVLLVLGTHVGVLWSIVGRVLARRQVTIVDNVRLWSSGAKMYIDWWISECYWCAMVCWRHSRTIGGSEPYVLEWKPVCG